LELKRELEEKSSFQKSLKEALRDRMKEVASNQREMLQYKSRAKHAEKSLRVTRALAKEESESSAVQISALKHSVSRSQEQVSLTLATLKEALQSVPLQSVPLFR